MDSDWKQRVLELRNWNDKQEALEYASVVEEAKYRCDLEACRHLMRTFVTDEDYEVQESVISVLSTAKPQDRQLALLEELPRIMVEAPDHADALVENEIRFHFDSFRETVRGIEPHLREAIDQVLKKESLTGQFPDLGL
ncbi:MAG: hypothetical protein KF831_16855 [Acidobacteria bacterium]|nr:hypothetical protein [Acidobacteriota bacterium]